jgi:hypothetical protein
MIRITTLLGSLLSVALFGSCLTAGPLQPPTPRKPDAKVVDAWKKAGAKVGWPVQDEFGRWILSEEAPKDPDAIITFHLLDFEPPGSVAKLPPPTVPFLLNLRSWMRPTDAHLKELAGFKNMRALDLSSQR